MKHIEKYWIFIVIAFGLSMFIKPAFCFFILGSVIFYIGIETFLFLRKVQKKGIECTGVILEYHVENKGYKTPVIEFTSSSGVYIKEKPFVYVSTDLSKIMSYKNMINKSVSILYDPDEPKKFILVDEKGFNYFFILILILVGIVCITLSICNLLGYIKIDW